MSSRSLGRGRCPKCGQEGVVVIRRIGGQEYVYVRHGKKWCYVGPLSKVSLEAILIHDSAEQVTTTSSRVAQPRVLSRKVWYRTLASILLRYRVPIILTVIVIALCALIYSEFFVNSAPPKHEISFRDLVMQLLSEYRCENSCIVFAQDLVRSSTLKAIVSKCISNGFRVIIIGRGEDFNEKLAYLLVDILFNKRKLGYAPVADLAIERLVRSIMSVKDCLYAAITLQLGKSRSDLGTYCITPTGNVKPERELKHLLDALLSKP